MPEIPASGNSVSSSVALGTIMHVNIPKHISTNESKSLFKKKENIDCYIIGKFMERSSAFPENIPFTISHLIFSILHNNFELV